MDYKKQYTDHFNRIGKNADDTAQLIKTYEQNTKGLDAATAFEALDGGRDFNLQQGDKQRYDALMQKRSGAKEKAQNYSEGTNINSGSGNTSGPGNSSTGQQDIGNTSQTVTQDNDQTSTINGNNNYVNQNQDNSVRNYGGDTRIFNYQGSGDPRKDTPGTAATLAGFYAPDDSHSAVAGRISRNQTLNKDAQKKYANTSHIAEGAIKRAENNAYIDPAALDKRIAERAKYSRAKADTMNADLFGDMGAFQMPDYKRGEPQKETETPDFEKMYKTYSDF